ncbi:MAG: DUF1326 domain-containing protein [Nevskia sp.]
MADAAWKIRGTGWNNCNCAWGCPCQFNSLPTHGDCRALGFIHIDEGHHGGTRLDGLNLATLWAWPGAVHLGNGKRQIIIDERANPAQRRALEAIAQGLDTEPGGSLMQIFATTVSTALETLYKPFDYALSVETRKARLRIPGVVESDGESIRNPITGEEHRARVSLPNGFEYREAEYLSGTTRARAGVELDLQASHAHINRFHWSSQGYVN